MGSARHRCVVAGSIKRPLPLQYLLRPRDESLPYIGLSGALPSTLPIAKSNATRAHQSLTLELTKEAREAATTPKGKAFIKLLRTHLDAILEPPITEPQQRVTPHEPQQVTTPAPNTPRPLQRVTNNPAIIQARNPTAKHSLLKTARTHQRVTRGNTPGAVPPITRDMLPGVTQDDEPEAPARRSQRTRHLTPSPPTVQFTALPGPCFTRARANIISQQALNALTTREALYKQVAFTHRELTLPEFVNARPNFAHYASPMVHPVTGDLISSYKHLMNDPATAEIWQTVFGKDFGGMAQGDAKTGQKGTNSMFVMKHNEIKWAYLDKQKFT
jgi:hypothetical protein